MLPQGGAIRLFFHQLREKRVHGLLQSRENGALGQLHHIDGDIPDQEHHGHRGAGD